MRSTERASMTPRVHSGARAGERRRALNDALGVGSDWEVTQARSVSGDVPCADGDHADRRPIAGAAPDPLRLPFRTTAPECCAEDRPKARGRLVRWQS